jgi:hypothetical protein
LTKNNIKNYFAISLIILSISSMMVVQNHASATSVSLGTAGSFAILSGGGITNGFSGQPIARGNVGHISTESAPYTFAAGYSDLSGVGPLGTTATLGTPLGDEHAALTAIGTWNGVTNTGLACTFTFANGPINLSTDTTHGQIGQYVPGVYCINGAASIGTTGINFNASGTYVFKIDGALTTVSGSSVTFNGAAGGSNANAGNLFWAPTGGASTFGTDQFSGTVLAGSAAITTGAAENDTNARFISESAVTTGGGSNLFSIPPLTPSITLNPVADPVGTTVLVSGSGFVGNSLVTIKYDGTQVATTTTTGTGAIPSLVEFAVPASALGPNTVTATDAASNTASATYTVQTVTVPEFPLGGMVLLAIASMGVYLAIRYKVINPIKLH